VKTAGALGIKRQYLKGKINKIATQSTTSSSNYYNNNNAIELHKGMNEFERMLAIKYTRSNLCSFCCLVTRMQANTLS
jgi:hypothetical protein